MLSGWICLNKHKGISSCAANNTVKRFFGLRRGVGYAGTLDPLADGVLPIAIGACTKQIPALMECSKGYMFRVLWNATSASMDMESEICYLDNHMRPSDTCIHDVLSMFTGWIEQIPPVYSAIKINGRKACDLIRKGKSPIMPIRKVHIYNLQYLGNDSFFCECSSGTYIRSLAYDIAVALGTCCVIDKLQRVFVGHFNISSSVTIDELSIECIVNPEVLHALHPKPIN